MRNEKKIARFLARVLLNPNLSFFVYFLFVASFGLSGKDSVFHFAMIFPFLLILIIFLNLRFFRILFHGLGLTEGVKINHVLEHGTVYFLKKMYGKRCRLFGRAREHGFRVGGVRSKKDIKEAFKRLCEHLDDGKTGIVLSRFCGSNVYYLQGVSLIMLTLTFACLAFLSLDTLHIQIILLANLVLYMLFRYPVGKFFQKRYVMSFDFSEARIVSVEKTKKRGVFERNPVYFVKTEVKRP